MSPSTDPPTQIGQGHLQVLKTCRLPPQYLEPWPTVQETSESDSATLRCRLGGPCPTLPLYLQSLVRTSRSRDHSKNPLGAPLGHHWEDPPPPSLTSERWSLHWSRTIISISWININVNQLGCVFKWNRAYYLKNIFFNNKKDFDIFKNNIVYFYKENNMTKQQTHVHLIFQCLKLLFFIIHAHFNLFWVYSSIMQFLIKKNSFDIVVGGIFTTFGCWPLTFEVIGQRWN